MRDTICLYKSTLHEDEKTLSNLFASSCAPTRQELKIVEHASAYFPGDMDKVARIDERDDERRECEAHHCEIYKYR